MKTSRKTQLRTTGLIAALAVSSLTVQSQSFYTYDAGLGTLPDAQGWTPLEQEAPASMLTNGLLHTFPAAFPDGVQFWQQTNAPLNFTTTPYVLEATLRIVSANYIPNIGTGQRSGYYLTAADTAGRQFAIGLASDGITINTDSGFVAGQSVPFTPFDTTDRVHTYRFIIEENTGTLFIDDVQFVSTPVGATGAVPPVAFNRVTFGDLSGRGVSEAELRQFRFASLAPHLSIDVSEVRVCWTSRTNKMYQVQYRSELTTNAWVDLGAPIAGNGTTNCVTDAVVGPRRFYQLVVLP